MAHFAEINKDNIVLRVLVFEDDFTPKDCADLFGGEWIQTSYNGNLRKNFAGIGYIYDGDSDVFIAPDKDTPVFDLPD